MYFVLFIGLSFFFLITVGLGPRDWSLITGRGGGDYKMGKSWVKNVLHPLPTG